MLSSVCLVDSCWSSLWFESGLQARRSIIVNSATTRKLYISVTAAVFKRVDFGVVNEMLGERKFSASCSSPRAS